MPVKDALYNPPVDDAIPLSRMDENKRMMDGNT